MILLLGSETDHHLRRVGDCLLARNADFAILCAQDFPVSDVGTIEFDSHAVHGSYRNNRAEISLKDVTAVWYRRLPNPTFDSSITNSESQRFALGEARAFLRGLWEVLNDLPWMNPLTPNQNAELKLYQLAVAQRIGLKIPRTLVTNDASKVRVFFDETDGDIIYKPLSSYATDAVVVDGKMIPSKCVYTNIIARDSLHNLECRIKFTPCVFQEYIPKLVELRITVVGESFFAAAIYSQNSAKSKIDWRKYDFDNTPYEPFELPAEMRKKLLMLLKELGLVYGAVDCIVTPSGDIYFLEINPGGQWLWVEILTGMSIGEAIADELIQLSRTRSNSTQANDQIVAPTPEATFEMGSSS
jgi:glutathione synthase/RimK-type ligase-like ATP-grasp enzyme